MRRAMETRSSTLAHGAATGWISDRNLVQPVASSHLISEVECEPPSPHLTKQPDTTLVTPGIPSFFCS